MADTKTDRLLDQQKKILDGLNENRAVMQQLLQVLREVGGFVIQVKGATDYLILHCNNCRTMLELKASSGIIIPGKENAAQVLHCPKCNKDFPTEGVNVQKVPNPNLSQQENGKEENK